MKRALRQHQHRRSQPQTSQMIRLWVTPSLAICRCGSAQEDGSCTYNKGRVRMHALSCRGMVVGMVRHNKAPAG